MINKTLEQIQEENRKAIIIANNPEAQSYEEALHDELGFNCVVFDKDNCYFERIICEDEGLYWAEQACAIGSRSEMENPNQYKIIGKPLSLDRVIRTLGRGWKLEVQDKNILYIFKRTSYVQWALTKPTLEQQSEETQREINKLLTNK